jgi:hypothetical protein
VQIGTQTVEIGLSWQEKAHLSFDSEAGVLFINVHEMATALERAFANVSRMLRNDSGLREQLLKMSKRARLPEACRSA